MAKRSKAVKWACEPLEVRRLFATVTWITHGDGNWSTGSNWSTGTPPTGNDNVVIDIPGLQLTVTYSGGATVQVNNLVNTELLVIGGGGGSWTGGVWDGSGRVQIDTGFAISGSADKIMRDGISLDNLGATTLGGTGNIVGQIGASIINEPGATFNVESDADITFPTGVGDGIFENGGTFIKSVGGTAPGDMTEIGGAQGFRFEDSITDVIAVNASFPGDCQIRQGTLDLGDDQNIANTYGGTFEVSSGATLEYDRGQANLIVIRPTDNIDIIPSITGAGRLDITGGTVQMYGKLAIHEVDVSAGSLLLQQNMVPLAGTSQSNTAPHRTMYGTADIVRLTGGTLGGNGGGHFTVADPDGIPLAYPIGTPIEYPALVVGNTFDWEGGTLSGTGRMVIDVTASNSVISTTNPKAIVGGFGVDILDETVWQDSGTITMDGGSAIYIHAGGTLWDQNDGTLTEGTIDSEGGELWNTGIILKSGGTGTTTIGVGIDFINDLNPLNFVTAGIPILDYFDDGSLPDLLAKLDIRSGTVSLQGNSINRDDFLIHPGATLSYDGGTNFNQTYIDSNDVINASILGVDGGGTLNLGNATFNSDLNALVDVPTVHFGDGTYTFDNTAGGAQVALVATFDGGSIGGAGTLEIQTSFLWDSGTFDGDGSGTSRLLIDTGAVVTIPSGDRTTTDDYSIDNRGTIEWTTSPGLLTVNGNFDQTSTGTFECSIAAGDPPLDSLQVSGTVTLDGALNLTSSTIPANGEVFTLIDNTGTGQVSGIFVGFPEGSSLTIGNAIYTISYVGNDGNDVTLTASLLPDITIATPDPIIEPTTGTVILLFTVSTSLSVTHDVTVDYATSDGTAIAGTDYVATTGTLTIPAGMTMGTIMVTILPSTITKPAQIFTVTLSDPAGGVLGTPSSATGTILDENGAPFISFSSTAYSVRDTAGLVAITVNRVDSPSVPVSVDYSTSPGTATPDVNYTSVSGTLNFAANVASLTFEVPIINDNKYDGTATTNGDLNFNLALTNAVGDGATIGTPSAVVTVIETILPHINVSDSSVVIPTTGVANLVFTVTLESNPSTVSVNYNTTDGTAIAGQDYTAIIGALTFLPGETSQTVSITILSDTQVTADKTLTLNLSNAVNASIVTTTAIGTLVNDNVPVVSIADTSITEPLGGQVNAVFAVSLSATPFKPVTVAYNTADLTAFAGIDYVAASGTLTIPIGQTTGYIDVPVNTTFSVQPGENFTVAISDPTEATLGTALATGSITNLPVNTVNFSAGHPFRYTGAQDTHVVISLKGPGTGVLNYLGLLINDAKEIILNDTTSASQLSISTNEPRSFLVNLTVNGSIKAIVAPAMSLQGVLNITGSVQRIQLDSLLGGNTLNIGSTADAAQPLTASFASVTNATLTSAEPLASLRVANWVNTTTGVAITAPSAAMISSSGNFSANVSIAGNLGQFHVGKSLYNSAINVGGNIKTLTAGVLSNSTIFAGVQSTVTTLPTSTSQFANTTSTIEQVSVRSTFSNSLIAAPVIGSVSLATADINNGGITFGVAGTSIMSVRGRGDRPFALSSATLGTPFTDEDLVIRLTV